MQGMTMYTPAQAEAIACLDQLLQIIACAGSGKTQVISQRIAAIFAQPGVEPLNIIAFTFTEKGAAELKERVLSIVQREIGDVTGLAEMFIGTMHGYCLDLLQRLVPEKFKFSVLTAITAQLFVDRYSAKSGLTSCPTTAKNGKLRRYIDSKLYLQVVSVLREDKIAIRRVPAGVIESFEKYMALLHENRCSTTRRSSAAPSTTSKVTSTRTTTLRAFRITFGMTSATSSSTSTRTSTRCRSDSYVASCGSGRTFAWWATTTRRSTSGAAVR
jgi:DNA helicase-2/ATP-dependent DNA helicase PcrA